MDFLETIIAQKKKEIANRQSRFPLADLEKQVESMPPVRSLWEKMAADEDFHFICEIKKASPSRGVIAEDVDVGSRARAYENGGASAISVLTDSPFFHGSPADLQTVRQVTDLPILRKDFIISPYQVVESRAMGADIILLIAAALPSETIQRLTILAHSLQLDVLLELHHQEDLDKIPPIGQKLILGVNNRNLRNFQVSLETSLQLKPLLPEALPAISESGVSTGEACRTLYQAGFRGVLIGEALMTSDHPRQMIHQLKEAVQRANPT